MDRWYILPEVNGENSLCDKSDNQLEERTGGITNQGIGGTSNQRTVGTIIQGIAGASNHRNGGTTN